MVASAFHFDPVRHAGRRGVGLRDSSGPVLSRTTQAALILVGAGGHHRSKGALQASAWMEAGYRVEDVDLDGQRVTFRKPTTKPKVERVGDTVLWNAELIKALRRHMDLTQAEFAQRLGVYQQTVSQWENSAYEPTLATSKYLTLIAEQAGFKY